MQMVKRLWFIREEVIGPCKGSQKNKEKFADVSYVSVQTRMLFQRSRRLQHQKGQRGIWKIENQNEEEGLPGHQGLCTIACGKDKVLEIPV